MIVHLLHAAGSGPRPVRAGVLALALALATPAAAQIAVPEIRSAVPGGELYAQADALFDAWKVGESYDILAAHLERWPRDYDARWRACRAALALGILEEDETVAEEWFRRAGEQGDASVALDAEGVDGLYWTAASRGRLALQYGPRTSTDLAQQMWDLTERLLAIDPEHPGAHNIMGKLNYEVESLSSIERFVGRLVLRKPFLSQTSWEQALFHHRKAVQIDPDVILFRKDLAETLFRSGDPDAAREVFEAALELPEVWPVDARFKDDMRAWLAENYED